MVRRVLIPLLAAAALLAFAVAPAAASGGSPSGALFLIRGHGWGHGVGMSQWGAQGYAEHAYTYEQILAAYFPGTTLETTPTTKIRVLLASGRKSLTISSDQPITVTDGNGAAHTLAAGATKLTPALALPVDGGAAQPLTPPLTFAPTGGSALILGRAYRGTITVNLVQKRLEAVNTLPLEQYVASVVASEMPSTWEPAALEAQAVASRSYALATRRVGGDFDVYSDTRSQAYGGLDAERPTATAAVAATAGQVLYFGSTPATTFFSSSSGGRTQTPADAWGGQDVPYLPSQPDPYDSISPYHNWGPVPVTAQALGRALGVRGQIVDATTVANSSLRVAQLDVRTLAAGVERTTAVTGATVAASLGLRSTWFRVSVLSLQPPLPNAPVSPGTNVTLTGVLRGASGAVVQERASGQQWNPLLTPKPDGQHAFTVAVRPKVTTWYRLAVSTASSPPIRIRVTAG